jgi:hypothetical protein
METKLAENNAIWMVEDSTALHLPGIQLMGARVTIL